MSDFLEAFGANRGIPRAPYRLDGRLRVEEQAYVFEEVAGFIGASRVTLDGRLVPVEGLAGSAFAIGVDGDALEEVVNTISDFDVRPGPYSVDGNVQFTAEGLEVPNLKLTRPAGEVNVVATLTRSRTDIQLNATGPNVQSVMRHFDGIYFDAAPFTMTLDAAMEDALIDVDELDIKIGELHVSAVGDVELEGDASGTNFAFNLEVPDLSAVGEFGDFRFLPQPATASARVVGGDSVLRVDDLQVNVGESDLRGRLTYTLGDVPALDLDLDSDRIVLLEREDPPSESADDGEAPAETPAVADEVVDDGRLIPDIPLSGERLRSMDAVVDIDIGHFEYGALLLRDFDLEASLDSGLLIVDRLAALGESGGFALRSRIEPQEVGVSATLDVAAQDFALGLGELNEDLGMTADVQINLSSTGPDVRALIGNSNGIVFVETRGGRFENTGLANLFFNDALQQIFSAINPFRKTDPYTTLECVVATSEIVDGVAASTPSSLISTDKILITLKSAIDLKSEGLELNVRTTPHKGITISASEILNPYIKVVGTLKEPSLAVDEAGVLLSGGAAVVTGGLSVLAKAAITRLAKSNDPCGDAAAAAIEVLGDRFPQLEVPMPTTADGDVHPAEGTESISPPDQTDP